MEKKEKRLVRSKTYFDLRKGITETNEISLNPVERRVKKDKLQKIKSLSENNGILPSRRKSTSESVNSNELIPTFNRQRLSRKLCSIPITIVDSGTKN